MADQPTRAEIDAAKAQLLAPRVPTAHELAAAEIAAEKAAVEAAERAAADAAKVAERKAFEAARVEAIFAECERDPSRYHFHRSDLAAFGAQSDPRALALRASVPCDRYLVSDAEPAVFDGVGGAMISPGKPAVYGMRTRAATEAEHEAAKLAAREARVR